MSFDSGQLIIGEPSTQVDRTTLIWDGGQFGFSATRGERGEASMQLCILPGESYDPQIGWPVWIYDPPIGVAGSECRFVGTIEDRDFGYIGDAGLQIISLSVLSLEQLYDTQPCPDVEFPDGTDAGSIAGYLFGTVTPPVSVTVGTIDTGVSLDKRTYSPQTNVWSAIKQLAVDSNLICYIDPRDQKFYFVANGVRTSPFTLASSDMLQNGSSPLVHFKQSRSDFRDRQVTQAQPGVLPPSNAQFDCDGVTSTFTLPTLADQILGAAFTTSIAGTATGNFTGNPAPGDTITIGDVIYTWQSLLDNTVQYEILIGANATANAVNLRAAINADAAQQGILYSSPTLRNTGVTALPPTAGLLPIRAVAMGTTGNDVSLSESTANFTWNTATISGGSNATSIPISVGISRTGTFGLSYTPGSAEIILSPTPGNGQTLTVTYIGPSSNLLATGNNAAGTLGVGSQTQLSSPRNVSTQAGITQQAGAELAGFSVMPGQFSFSTYHDGIYPGDTLPVALTVPAALAAQVNASGPWLVQDVRGEWVEGFENLPDDNPDRHFRCEVTCINSVQFNPYQQTLQRMLDLGVSKTPLTTPVEPITGGNDAQLLVYQFPIQIADTTVGSDKSPHISLATPLFSLSPLNYRVLQALRLQGVLRQVLTAALVIRINKVSFGSPSFTSAWDFTFPSGWGIDDPIYLAIEGEINNGDTIYISVLSGPSPVVTDANGVAAITLVAA